MPCVHAALLFLSCGRAVVAALPGAKFNILR